MAVIRTYGCDECGAEWEFWHDSGDENAPPCPNCENGAPEWRPMGFRMTGTKSKAMDLTQKIVEEQYGLTNMRDNNRPGDVAAITPTKTTQEIEAQARQDVEMVSAMKNSLNPQLQKMADGFFAGGASNGPAPAQAGQQQMLSTARAASAMARKEGVSPMALLHKAGKEGKLHMPVRPLNRR